MDCIGMWKLLPLHTMCKKVAAFVHTQGKHHHTASGNEILACVLMVQAGAPHFVHARVIVLTQD